jgi:hypothetical protein
LEPARDASQLFLFRGLGLRELSERTHNPVRAALPLLHTLLGRKGASVHFYRNCPGKFLFGVGWSEVDIVSIILPVNIREYLGII